MKIKYNSEKFDFKLIVLLLIIVIFGIFSNISLPLNERIKDSEIDMLFHLRGSRQIADDIVIIFIGDEDVKALSKYGNWPITRDYYGFMTHILHSMGAKLIAYDILFSKTDQHYSEYDAMLADFFEEAGNVCLPMVFSQLTKNKIHSEFPELMNSELPEYPVQKFRDHIEGMGFSNLGKEAIIRTIPLAISSGDSFVTSFGCELARLYLDCTKNIEIEPGSLILSDSTGKRYPLPIMRNGCFRLNHIGDISNFHTISFLDVLKAVESTPDSINFKDKLALVAVTAPGIATLKATPLTNLLPAVFIHATVAENIINQTYLREYSVLLQWFLILVAVAGMWGIWIVRSKLTVTVGTISFLFIYWLICAKVFAIYNYVFPLFYPTLACLGTLIFLIVDHYKHQRMQSVTIQSLLNDEVDSKETELQDARRKLVEVQNQLKEEATASEQTRVLVGEKEREILKLEKDIRDLNAHILPQDNQVNIQFTEIVHGSKSIMAEVLDLVMKVSYDDIPVLILGETGTGKEIIARAIHQTSNRKNESFVAINCGALPETLLESELFGHEKGSFTGAHSRRRGRFEIANGGTIFLDEITETSPAFQARLLRVLQESAFERIGGEQTLRVEVRVIAATNKDIHKEMEEGSFRSDLYYRLNGFPIHIPPLRDRKDDIPLLAIYFLKKHGYQTVSAFSGRSMEILQRYQWPGNVRELENFVRRAAILAQSEGRNIIRECDLPNEMIQFEKTLIDPDAPEYKPLDVQILETMRSLEFSRSAISQTAKILGNRDRGTITEYFRGICFEHLVKSDFNIDKAATAIAETQDEKVADRVKSKINGYLKNLAGYNDENLENSKKWSSAFKGLPKMYHPFLQDVIDEIIMKEEK